MESFRRRIDAYQKNLSDTPTHAMPSKEKRDSEAPAVPVFLKTPDPERIAGKLASSGPGKIARFLLILGKNEAAEILRFFTEAEVELIMKELVGLHSVTATERYELLKEFGFILGTRGQAVAGGPQAARSFLVAAFGEHTGSALFRRFVLDKAQPKGFGFLSDLEPSQLRLLFKDESAPVIAIVLSRADSETGSRIISVLDSTKRTATLLRVGRMKKVDNEILQRVEEALIEKIRKQGRVVSTEIDGKNTIAAILRSMDTANGRKILDRLEDFDPELSADIEDRLFTLESLTLMIDRDLQTVLREYDDGHLALILKGKSEDIRAKILRNVSERRRSLIMEEYRNLGPVRKKDVDDASHEFVEHLKELDRKGQIILPNPNEEYL
jgi:flagellar motor switch protein FliG